MKILISEEIEERDKRMLEFIEPNKNDKILVIGTGVYPKVESFLYSKYGCKNIISGDIDNKNIENGRKLLPNLHFIYLDAQKPLSFKDHTFDKVIMTEVLEHLEDEEIILQEIKRVLKKSGLLMLSVPRTRWYNLFSPITWVQHKREYTPARVKNVLENNNFRITKLFLGGNFYSLLNLWLHLFFKYVFRKLYLDSFFKREIDTAYLKSYKGKGTDIILQAQIA